MKLLKTILFVFISVSAFSQKNYVDGFIILKNQTDTLKGRIDDQDWISNPTRINFKDVNNSEQSYEIAELSSFGITGKENYLVAKTDLDITPFTTNALLKDRNLIVKKDVILAFLVLLKADYTLLYLNDDTNKQHFFYKEGEKITELINHSFLEERNGKVFEFNNKLYQKQLELLFNNCAKTIKTNNLTYEIRTMTDKFIEFSECIGCNYTCYVKKKEDKGIFAVGVMAGISSDRNLVAHGVYTTYFSSKTIVPNMLFGLSVSFFTKRNLNRTSFVFETFFNRENVKIEALNYSTSINYLNFVPLMRHQFNIRSKIKPFVGGGIHIKHIPTFNSGIQVYGPPISIFLVGEGGIKWNNLLASARFKFMPQKNSEGITVYKQDGVDRIIYERINFQFSLTYLLYTTAKKAK
ncbi:hypothetical protein [Emticicia soli]|uniref:Outer membrane protein beta-barrel domain-containing protein n=1 Tax=Emticicia soli TaxID=2027878 RepID=A0ABW5J2Z2_9BACT